MPGSYDNDGSDKVNEDQILFHFGWAEFRNQVTVLADLLEKMRLAEYIAYLNRPVRLLLINFAVGLLRGLGAAVGASLLFGLVIIWLKDLGMLNLPVIGGIIAELVKIVNSHINQ